ncbi:hypothetical protein [Helicobacter trogontum]|uniref:Uncharacterized protein n=1 Tax=Helicobacter trogontum TaxID=50960 RepID=A0A099VCT5_9HELI|nr:hypothetical protein [Helicobacter trogontum]TLD84665.1 hypothetical protein LS81_001255 [Helicobacter trogontum]
MTNKFLILGKRLGAVALGATLLCVSVQGATLKEIEAQKEAEEKARSRSVSTLKENEVIIAYDDNVIAELAHDIPKDKKKILKQALYYSNVASEKYYKKEALGHVFETNHVTSGLCNPEYLIEPYRNIEVTKLDRKRLLSGKHQAGSSFDATKYGFIDDCILAITWAAAREYEQTHNKQYYWEGKGFSQTRLNEKKALQKWLDGVFYPYINSLDVTDYDYIKRYLIDIKKAMVIKNK